MELPPCLERRVLELSARTGRSVEEVLEAALRLYDALSRPVEPAPRMVPPTGLP